MHHYEERLESDLRRIRELLAAIGTRVERAIHDAVHALLAQTPEQSYAVMLGDHAVNRSVREVDRLCHAFVARHLPSAGHLRFVSSVLRLNVALERVGDYAVSIARETVQLSDPPPERLARDLELMSDQSRSALRQAMEAFIDGNAELARGTAGLAAQTGSIFRKVFSDLLAEEKQDHPLRDLFALLVALHRLERVSDQAKNICEETLFTVLGETKAPKRYRILFLDRTSAVLAPLAEAFARKAFPESGRYASAGLEPVKDLAPALKAFLAASGLDTQEALAPSRFEPVHDVLADYHVLVGLGEDPRRHVERLPYQLVVQRWDLGELPGEPTEADVETVYKLLSVKIRELLETLRGPQAS